MKKFINDNVAWIALAALAMSAYCIYTMNKKPAESTEVTAA